MLDRHRLPEYLAGHCVRKPSEPLAGPRLIVCFPYGRNSDDTSERRLYVGTPKARNRLRRQPSPLILGRPGRKTRNEVAGEKTIDGHDRNRRQQGPRHQRSPEEHVAADKLGGNADWKDLLGGG